MKNKIFIFALCCLVSFVLSNSSNVPDEDWGYVDVRPGAHMFWWLYGAKDVNNRNNLPLVMWLQGGPGASSTGFGNFGEIGPLDVHLKPRPYTWQNVANLIFVDNPVGTGYSYVDDPRLFTTNNHQIATDLVSLLAGFLAKHPSFQDNPFYVFCESYGGKMASGFSNALRIAINQGTIKVNFKGVALGDSWIKPMSFVNLWADYLYNLAEIDEVGHKLISDMAAKTQAAVNDKKWENATELWGRTEDVLLKVSAYVDFYNVLNRAPDDSKLFAEGLTPFERSVKRRLQVYAQDPLQVLMNGVIKQKLHIPAKVVWGGQSSQVFSALSGDFMQSVVPTVDLLLQIGVNVTVYTGNLDLICCSVGTFDWMNELTWSGYKSWKSQSRLTIRDSKNIIVGFEKSYQNLRFFTILSAGHMVPSDQPEAATIMLKKIIQQ